MYAVIEHWGSGIPKIFEICKEENIEEPELIDMGYAFRVNLYRSERQWKTVQETSKTVQEIIPLSKSELAVLRLLSNNQKMTIKEYLLYYYFKESGTIKNKNKSDNSTIYKFNI